MAQIVAGVAASHSPQLSSGVDMWNDHGERDRRNKQLLGKDAEFHTYDELLESADPGLMAELDPAVWAQKYHRCQVALTDLAELLARAAPDVVVVIGDDQREIFGDEASPTFACFLGTELFDWPRSPEQMVDLPAGLRAASWAAHGEQRERHAVSVELSRHVAETLNGADFDVMVFTSQPRDRSLGHAFTFPRYRLGLPSTTQIVPVFINTYYPPNVPSAQRCYEFGRVVAQAVEAWPADARVGVVASGGLSHFVVDEELDRRVLRALTERDAATLGSLSRKQMRSGTSEILNWVAAAGALENLKAKVLDYVPGYRTPAGTGAGMAFVSWT